MSPKLGRGEGIIAGVKEFSSCVCYGVEMKGARPLDGMLYGHLAQPSKGQLGVVEGSPWSLVHLQTPGPAVIFIPSLYLKADSWSVLQPTLSLGFPHSRQRKPASKGPIALWLLL